MKLTLIEKHQETPDCVSFIFRPAQPTGWTAGQYFRYRMDDQTSDDRGNNRFFTCANAPFEENIRITTRFAEKGSSFKNHLQTMEVDQSIEATGPFGDFTLENPEKDKEYVFIAGGIGITPFRAILLDLDFNEKTFPITLLYANRDQNIVFREIFDELAKNHPNLKIGYIISPIKIDGTYIQQNVPDFTTKIYYLSGPEPMVKGIKDQLLELKIPEEQIKTDYFPGYAE